MNTPRLRRGRGIASSSFIVFLTCTRYWYSYIVYFVCDSASEFGAMGSTSFLGFSYPNLLLIFRNLLFLGTCACSMAGEGKYKKAYSKTLY